MVAFGPTIPNVADVRDPDDNVIDDSLSPAERIGGALSDWLQDRPRHQRHWRVNPTEAALVAVVIAVTLLVVSGVLGSWSYWSTTNNRDVTQLIEIITLWADVPIGLALLGAALLAQYQSRRSCDEFELYLGEDETDDDDLDEGIDIEHLTRLLRSLRRTRLATMVIAILGFLTAVAAMTSLIWVFSSTGVSAGTKTPWYGYLGYVLARLAAAIPALACLVIAPRGWARGSRLLKADEADAPFEDEPELPAEPGAIDR
jgi:hypothetical protein